MGKCGCFFFARQLFSPGKLNSSGVRDLVVRCLLLNPEVSCSNRCVCANFVSSILEQNGPSFLFFRTMRPKNFGSLQRAQPFYSFQDCESFQKEYFCLKTRFSQDHHAISEFCFFLKTGVFSHLFSLKPLNFTTNETFSENK